jgi:hypothetical protein
VTCPKTFFIVLIALGIGAGLGARAGDDCIRWAVELGAASTLEERIEVLRRLARSAPQLDSRGSKESTFCTSGGCATVTRNWFFRLLDLGVSLKPVRAEEHNFLIDPSAGRGREIVWDGTYLQFVALPPERMVSLPKQFVGTVGELREFFASHWEWIDRADLRAVPEPKDVDAFMRYYYLSAIPEGRRMPNFYEDFLRTGRRR